jgi:flagellar hook-length control protein FliK
MELLSKLTGIQTATDHGKQALGILDEISTNFESALRAAQNKKDGEANLAESKSPPPARKPLREDKTPEEKPEQDAPPLSETAPQPSTEAEAVPAEPSAQVESLSLAESKKEASTEEESAPLNTEFDPSRQESTAAPDTEGAAEAKALEDTRSGEIEDAHEDAAKDAHTQPVQKDTKAEHLAKPDAEPVLAAGSNASAETHLEDGVSEESSLDSAATPTSGKDAAVEEEQELSSPNETALAVGQVEGAVDEALPVETAAILEKEVRESAAPNEVVSGDLPQEVMAPALPAASTPLESSTPLEATAEAEAEDAPRALALPQEPIETVISSAVEGTADDRSVEGLDLPRQAIQAEPALDLTLTAPSGADADEVSEDFHSLQPSTNEVVLELSKEETQQILQGLQEISQSTQLQPFVSEQLSPKLIEGLRAVQSSLLAVEGRSAETQSTPSGPNNPLDALAQQEAKTSEAREAGRAQPPQLDTLRGRIVQQVKMQLKVNLKGTVGEVRLQLEPEFLGKVRVKLLLEGDSTRAHFVVENQTVKEMLQRSLPTLEDALKEQGIDVSSVDVDVASDQTDGFGGGRSFATQEDQEAVRSWLASFGSLAHGAEEEEEQETVSDHESSDALNVVI